MTPQELAENVETVIRQCTERVGPDSIGARQYYVEGQPQKFETMSFPDLAQYYREELLDLVNYAVMTTIRIDRLQAAFVERLAELEPSCRVCGCTDDDCSGCVERSGEPCHWVEPDLCSACAAMGGAA